MKFYVRVFIVSLSWFILINFMSFGATVYASAAASGSTVPFSSLSKEEQDIFLKAAERLVEDIFNLSEGPTITYTDPDGTTYTGTKDEIMQQIQEKVNADYVSGIKDSDGTTLYYIFTHTEDDLSSVILDEYCSATHKSSENGRHGGGGRIRASDYNTSINNVLGKIYSNSLSLGIDIINGKPQNVTTVKEDLYISVFDTLGLEYTVSPSLLDYQFNMVTDDSYVSSQYYTPFFITSDNKLYLFRCSIQTGYNGDFNKMFYQFFGQNSSTQTLTISYNFHYPGKFSFRFVDNSGHLYFCLLSSSYFPNSNSLLYYQYTNGKPGVSNAPMLFYDYRDGLDPPSSAQLNIDFINNALPDNVDISFVNSVDNSDSLTDSEILSADIIAAGCFNGQGYSSSIFNAAGQMLLSSDNAVSGGDKTINSDLTAWQKGIYLLAHQQGISYEDMLQKGVNLVLGNNGIMSIEGIDGVQYSLSELVKQYDEIIGSVGDISGDLSGLLDYLKSLNIEGLESYISSIEGTLNDLNERDKDKSAVLGDCLGSLKDLQETLDGLNLESVSEDIHTIANSISQALELEDVSNVQGMDSTFIIDKFPFSLPFDLYHIVTLFVREPVEPIFTIPIETEINAFGLNEKIDEEIVLDLTMFKINNVDIVQAVLRFSIIVGYVIMLIKVTTKLFV